MNPPRALSFLEAKGLLETFSGGEALSFVFACSGTAEVFDLYLRAAAAKRGRSASPALLPFNTLGQSLRREADAGTREVFLLLPWDLVPEADWRSGVPEQSDETHLRAAADETVVLLARRPNGRILYLPAPIAPLFSHPARCVALEHYLKSLVVALGADLLPEEAFGLSTYLTSGNPVTGRWIGPVAEAVVEAAVAPTSVEAKKVLVTDLDNVLWSGIVAEDGPQGIAFDAAGRGYRHFVYQTLLRRLRGEGTLLAAVSRNDPEPALAPLRGGQMTLGEDDFVSILVSYHAKSAQIRELAARLNLGLDAFVFVDDNPVELAEVSLALPAVRCVAFPVGDDALPRFCHDLSRLFARSTITPEDRERTTLYRRRLEGMAPSTLEGADLSRFLQDLGMKLTIHDRSRGDRTRALQLINKTNQFNLNGIRVSDEELERILSAGGRLYGASLADRTGDHGEILACLIDGGVISALVMSCRVFQRRVEYAFLAWLAGQPHPPTALRWAHTPRNEPFAQFVRELAGSVNGDGLVPLDLPWIRQSYASDERLFSLDLPQLVPAG